MNLALSFFNRFSRKNIIILGILLLFILWVNNILSNALNYTDLNLDEKISNHFINKFNMVETNIDGVTAWTLAFFAWRRNSWVSPTAPWSGATANLNTRA